MGRSIEQRWQRAQGYLARTQPAPARAVLEAMRAQDPLHVRTHLLASQIAWRDGRVRDAASAALEALRMAPVDPELLCDTVDALLQAGEVMAARACLARPELNDAIVPALLLRMADFRQRLNENTESLALVERAIAAGAGDCDTQFHHAAQLYFHGRMADAEAVLDVCLETMPEHGQAAFTLSALKTQTSTSNHLAQLDLGLTRVARGTLAHAALEFARYKEFEDLGCYDDGWRALVAGNAAMHARNRFDVQRQVTSLDRLIAACTTNPLRISSAATEGPLPIFVLGFPRSGTTLLDRMLGGHPAVQSAGELVDFGAQLQWLADTRIASGDAYLGRLATLDFAELGKRYLAQTQWRSRGKLFFIDKQPPNWEVAGLIHAALPQAKILHLVRDPIDVCFSNWRAFFGDNYGYSYDLNALGAWHQAYRRLMAYWHRAIPGAILDVSYAELAANPERTMRQVLDHCGLAWTPGCATLDGNPAPVMTLSAAQVRGAIRPRVDLWRNYASHLAPLFTALGNTPIT